MQIETCEKPENWPANERENWLDIIADKAEEFRNKPTYKTREILLALLTEHDLNQWHTAGLLRVTDYEVGIINTLYLIGKALQVPPLISYIYNLIGDSTRMMKMASWFPAGDMTYEIKAYENGLIPTLKLYHFAYQEYTIKKDAPLSEHIIGIVEEVVRQDSETISDITHAYVSMLFDLSCMIGTKRQKLWEFTREELNQLFSLEARLLKLDNQSPVIRPIKGVLLMQISNFILKSRNEYNHDYICKYLSKETAVRSYDNQQIWMKKTELLNDEREQKVIPELFTDDDTWIEYDWIKNIDFTATREYYVSCFSKTINNEDMKRDYGQCVYGYKNDRIAATIAPIQIQHLRRREDIEGTEELPKYIDRPAFAQVLAFDVLYNKEEAKEELKYLFSIIDTFNMSNADKKTFLEEIMQYWILSVKDDKWSGERERRYVIFYYDEYDYKEVERDDMFLKVKTSLFLIPDFLIGDSSVKPLIKEQLRAKRKAMYCREYLFCENCLMQDHDAIHNRPDCCPVCGSKRIKVIRE